MRPQIFIGGYDLHWVSNPDRWARSAVCYEATMQTDEVAEWLRRWTANPLCSARVGSNPILVAGIRSLLHGSSSFFISTSLQIAKNNASYYRSEGSGFVSRLAGIKLQHENTRPYKLRTQSEASHFSLVLQSLFEFLRCRQTLRDSEVKPSHNLLSSRDPPGRDDHASLKKINEQESTDLTTFSHFSRISLITDIFVYLCFKCETHCIYVNSKAFSRPWMTWS